MGIKSSKHPPNLIFHFICIERDKQQRIRVFYPFLHSKHLVVNFSCGFQSYTKTLYDAVSE